MDCPSFQCARTISELLVRCEELQWSRDRVARKLCTFIDDWSHESFAGSPIADDSEMWRILQEAVDDLKNRIIPQV